MFVYQIMNGTFSLNWEMAQKKTSNKLSVLLNGLFVELHERMKLCSAQTHKICYIRGLLHAYDKSLSILLYRQTSPSTENIIH
jgi:hypothetical protein